MKYTQAQIKKFLEPETRFHMSAHVIQTEAVEMCRQLQKQVDAAIEYLECIEKHAEGNSSLMALRALETLKELGV